MDKTRNQLADAIAVEDSAATEQANSVSNRITCDKTDATLECDSINTGNLACAAENVASVTAPVELNVTSNEVDHKQRDRIDYIRGVFSQFKPTSSLEIATEYNQSLLKASSLLSEHPNTNHILINPSSHTDFQHTYDLSPHNPNASDEELDYTDLINRLTNFKATPPDDFISPDEILNGLQHSDADIAGITNSEEQEVDNIEYVSAKSAEVLPELIFQGQRIDFAILGGWRTFDYIFTDFFYIDKLLEINGVILFDHANKPSVRKLCHFIVSNLPYKFVSNIKRRRPRPIIEQLLERHIHQLPFLGNRVKQYIRPEFLDTEYADHLDSPMVTLQKIAKDQRADHYHEAF